MSDFNLVHIQLVRNPYESFNILPNPYQISIEVAKPTADWFSLPERKIPPAQSYKTFVYLCYAWTSSLTCCWATGATIFLLLAAFCFNYIRTLFKINVPREALSHKARVYELLQTLKPCRSVYNKWTITKSQLQLWNLRAHQHTVFVGFCPVPLLGLGLGLGGCRERYKVRCGWKIAAGIVTSPGAQNKHSSFPLEHFQCTVYFSV